ncbi:hypothetical protein Y027_4861 [Burkholderia pseudomallei TSV5]|nr:hypothetical protein Y027_4861 [Burkholderia pseudomallei TSV5]KGX69023.1 hypothetical protein Y026_4739 [Burkholderia pseudomallei TSV28]
MPYCGCELYGPYAFGATHALSDSAAAEASAKSRVVFVKAARFVVVVWMGFVFMVAGGYCYTPAV